MITNILSRFMGFSTSTVRQISGESIKISGDFPASALAPEFFPRHMNFNRLENCCVNEILFSVFICSQLLLLGGAV
jgi:hypothetical protein